MNNPDQNQKPSNDQNSAQQQQGQSSPDKANRQQQAERTEDTSDVKKPQDNNVKSDTNKDAQK